MDSCGEEILSQGKVASLTDWMGNDTLGEGFFLDWSVWDFSNLQERLHLMLLMFQDVIKNCNRKQNEIQNQFWLPLKHQQLDVQILFEDRTDRPGFYITESQKFWLFLVQMHLSQF